MTGRNCDSQDFLAMNMVMISGVDKEGWAKDRNDCNEWGSGLGTSREGGEGRDNDYLDFLRIKKKEKRLR